MNQIKPQESFCPDCRESFNSQEELDAHRAAANHPALDREDKLECERCGFVMESEEELRRHIEQNHARAGA